MSVDKVGNYFFYVHAKQEYDNGKTKLQSDLFFSPTKEMPLVPPTLMLLVHILSFPFSELAFLSCVCFDHCYSWGAGSVPYTSLY